MLGLESSVSGNMRITFLEKIIRNFFGVDFFYFPACAEK